MRDGDARRRDVAGPAARGGAARGLDLLKRTAKEFGDDRLVHWAAALTYYAILSIFPALLVLISILGLLGQPATQPLIDNLSAFAPGPAQEILTNTLRGLESAQESAGAALAAGLASAIWAGSGYIGAFMEASNAVWDVEEGRSLWKRIPLRVAITIAMVLLLALTAILVVVSGPIARDLGTLLGLGDAAVTAWSIGKWPVLIALVSLVFALLYWAAPNVRPPGFRWVGPGGALAVLLWIGASAGFAFYVAAFASYSKLYGSLGGVIVFLVWLWISNVAILLGAEFNAELQRGRQIEAGMRPPDREPYLPPRDPPHD